MPQGSVSQAKYHDGSYLHCKLDFQRFGSDASRPAQVNIPLAKNKWKIGTWNVCSMYVGKLQMVKSEMINYYIAICGMSQMWQKSCGYSDHSEFMVYKSNNKENWKNGVGYIINGSINKFIMGFNPLNSRMAWIKYRPNHLTKISCKSMQQLLSQMNEKLRISIYNSNIY